MIIFEKRIGDAISTVNKRGQLHSYNDKPAIHNLKTESKMFYRNGVIHRGNDKPAIITKTETVYMKNGKYHRKNGPAYKHINGEIKYYMNGKLHNFLEEEPAVINGSYKAWYIHGVLIKEIGKE